MNNLITHFMSNLHYYEVDNNPVHDDEELAQRIMNNMGQDPPGCHPYSMFNPNKPTFSRMEYVEALEILFNSNVSLRDSIRSYVAHCYPTSQWAAKFGVEVL